MALRSTVPDGRTRSHRFISAHDTTDCRLDHTSRQLPLTTNISPHNRICKQSIPQFTTDATKITHFTEIAAVRENCIHTTANGRKPRNRPLKKVAWLYTGLPKKVSHYQISKNCVKSYWSLPMRLDFFVKLKKWSSTIILSVGIKYSLCDILFDVNSYAWPTN